MPKLLIRDGTGPGEGNFLSFDLAQVLAILGPRTARSSWSYRDLWFVTHDEQDLPELEQESDATQRLSGQELLAAADRILQVIDGEFAAFDRDESTPWVVVRAVDSSFWEVESADPHVLEAVRAGFKDVEDDL
jgi:hypothetical protein